MLAAHGSNLGWRCLCVCDVVELGVYGRSFRVWGVEFVAEHLGLGSALRGKYWYVECFGSGLPEP